MNETDTGNGNRRRAERLGFVSPCRLDLNSPAWARIPEPLSGKTENVTAHGAKVCFNDFERHRYERWANSIESGTYLGVNIRIPHGAVPLELPGQVVWVNFRGEPGAVEGKLYAGILLSVMKPSVLKELHELLYAISTGSYDGQEFE
ncbi:PilZ domain-containing protein [bacterium]|nr:PilZ domain-containing protein [bacterium]